MTGENPVIFLFVLRVVFCYFYGIIIPTGYLKLPQKSQKKAYFFRVAIKNVSRKNEVKTNTFHGTCVDTSSHGLLGVLKKIFGK